MRGSRFRSRMRSAARRRKCAISSSLAFQRWRSWLRVFDQHFMRADGVHAVVDTVAAAVGLAFDAVEGPGMNDRTRRPWRAGRVGRFRDYLQRRRGGIAETAGKFEARSSVGRIIAGHDPGAGDGILAEFHDGRRTPGQNWSQPRIVAVISRRAMRNGEPERAVRICYNPPKPRLIRRGR